MWKIFNWLRKDKKEEKIISQEDWDKMSLEEKGKEVFSIYNGYRRFNYKTEEDALVAIVYEILIDFPKKDKEEMILFIYNKLTKQKEEQLKIRKEKDDLIARLKGLEN